MSSVSPSSGERPSLSVLTPAYEAGRFLPSALASVAGRGVQHVVMDGGSRDGTVALLEAAPEVLWRSEPDRGQSHALNKALAEAQGEWIGWLNADEFYLPGVLDWVQRRLAVGDVDVLYGDWAEVDTDGRLLRLVTNHGWSPTVLRRVGCYVPSCATFVRRELLEQVGGWREDLRTLMDLDLWLRLDGAHYRYLPRTLTAFRIHPGQVTAAGHSEADLAEFAELRRRHGITRNLATRGAGRAAHMALKLASGGYLRQFRSTGAGGVSAARRAPAPSR